LEGALDGLAQPGGGASRFRVIVDVRVVAAVGRRIYSFAIAECPRPDLRGADCGQARNRDAPPSLPQVVAIEAVGAIAQRDSSCGIGPSDLSAGAAVAEGSGRIGLAEAAVVRHPVSACEHYAQRAVYRHAEYRILVARRSHSQRIFQHSGLPDLAAALGAIVKQTLVEQRKVTGSHDSSAARNPSFAHVGTIEAKNRFLRNLGFR